MIKFIQINFILGALALGTPFLIGTFSLVGLITLYKTRTKLYNYYKDKTQEFNVDLLKSLEKKRSKIKDIDKKLLDIDNDSKYFNDLAIKYKLIYKNNILENE